jgi:hypothetical protein
MGEQVIEALVEMIHLRKKMTMMMV